jgi:hypothetical protein
MFTMSICGARIRQINHLEYENISTLWSGVRVYGFGYGSIIACSDAERVGFGNWFAKR